MVPAKANISTKRRAVNALMADLYIDFLLLSYKDDGSGLGFYAEHQLKKHQFSGVLGGNLPRSAGSNHWRSA
jgi:hypothetical protein